MKYVLIACLIALSYYIILPYITKNYMWPEKITNAPVFIFFLVFFVHEISYIAFNLMLFFIYRADNPLFEQFKVHSGKWPWQSNSIEFKSLLVRSLKQIGFNQLILTPVLLYLNVILFKKTQLRVDLNSFPSLLELIWQIYFFTFCDDFLFYWSHRLLHWNRVYPYIHKKHHEYKVTIGIASEYAHPIEFALGNILPTNLGSMILGPKVHAFTYAFWICEKIYKTTEGHSGYQFPWSPTTLMPFKNSSEHHNFHHLLFKGNYGGHFNFWDWFCGTNHPDYLKSLEIKKEKIN